MCEYIYIYIEREREGEITMVVKTMKIHLTTFHRIILVSFVGSWRVMGTPNRTQGQIINIIVHRWEKGRGGSSSRKPKKERKKKPSIPQERKHLQQLVVCRHYCRCTRAIAQALLCSLMRSVCFVRGSPRLLLFAGTQPRPTTTCTPLSRPIGRIHYIVQLKTTRWCDRPTTTCTPLSRPIGRIHYIVQLKTTGWCDLYYTKRANPNPLTPKEEDHRRRTDKHLKYYLYI